MAVALLVTGQQSPMLQGVRAVFAESFERIHRSNLIGMGILPLQFEEGENAESLGLDGSEVITIASIDFSRGLPDPSVVDVVATKQDGRRCPLKRLCELTRRLKVRISIMAEFCNTY